MTKRKIFRSYLPRDLSPGHFYTIEEWNKYTNIFHGFGTKRNEEGRKRKKDWFRGSIKLEGKEYPVVALRQVHGEDVLIFNGEPHQDLWLKEGDALLTQTPGYALAVFTADCLPILIFDPEQEVVGIVHAGWRGTAKGIVAKAIKKMQEVFHSAIVDIQIALGPAICPLCLEVDEPVREAFKNGKITWEEVAFAKGKGKWRLDIYKANILLLTACGIKDKNIFTFEACPSCQREDYYSYRREGGDTGRMINFIGLKKPNFGKNS